MSNVTMAGFPGVGCTVLLGKKTHCASAGRPPQERATLFANEPRLATLKVIGALVLPTGILILLGEGVLKV
jgi:hypothetical protein